VRFKFSPHRRTIAKKICTLCFCFVRQGQSEAHSPPPSFPASPSFCPVCLSFDWTALVAFFPRPPFCFLQRGICGRPALFDDLLLILSPPFSFPLSLFFLVVAALAFFLFPSFVFFASCVHPLFVRSTCRLDADASDSFFFPYDLPLLWQPTFKAEGCFDRNCAASFGPLTNSVSPSIPYDRHSFIPPPSFRYRASSHRLSYDVSFPRPCNRYPTSSSAFLSSYFDVSSLHVGDYHSDPRRTQCFFPGVINPTMISSAAFFFFNFLEKVFFLWCVIVKYEGVSSLFF